MNDISKLKGFTQVDNNIIYAGLSAEAFYVLVYILSKPKGWTFRQPLISEDLGLTMHKVRLGTTELQEKGYLTISKKRLKNGRGFSTEYIIHKKPNKWLVWSK